MYTQLATSPQALIIDDDTDTCELFCHMLDRAGFRTQFVTTVEAGLTLQKSNDFDLILLDLNLGTTHSLEKIPDLLKSSKTSRLWVLTAHGSIELAVKAMRLAASGFFTKDQGAEAIVNELKAAFFSQSVVKENAAESGADQFGLIGVSPAMQLIRQNIQRMKDVSSTVIICGESGTGKELIAQALHQSSLRKNAAFAAINCGAIPEQLLESELFGHKRGSFTDAKSDHIGFFEKCSDGTLFLDEISELPFSLQVKLLRVLQEREVCKVGSTQAVKINTRVIAATNRKLEDKVHEGLFREDLYYRLSILRIDSPPLRERRSDIPILVRAFVDRYASSLGKPLRYPTDGTMEKVVGYEWPGNVRELQNSIERASVLSMDGTLQLEDLFPKHFLSYENEASTQNLESSLAPFCTEKLQFERDYLTRLLKATKGNISEAARLSGQHRPQLYRLMHKYSIQPELYSDRK